MNKLVKKSLEGGIPLTSLLLALVLGAIALFYTPREEEPQIVVPMVDVLIETLGFLQARWHGK